MADTNEDLIQELISSGYLKTPLIIESFRAIDRKDFVPEDLQSEAYLNTALPIGFGQTISQPLVVAFMLELLDPKPGDIILDVGAGSGWKAALLAYCVSGLRKHATITKNNTASGIVFSIERIPALKEMAEKNIAKYNFIDKGVVKVILGDGSNSATLLKISGGKHFDKIISGAAGKQIPEAWKKQLKVGGRIVAPVEHDIMVLDKISRQEFKEQRHEGFSFVPLISD